MPISLTDHRCLRPRWLASPARSIGACARRVDGVLHRAGSSGPPRLIEMVDYDGHRCRYRALNELGDGEEWLEERSGDEYRCCARTIVARLRTLADDQVDRLSVLDALISGDGRLWIAVKNDRQRRSRWIAVTGPG